MQGQWPPWRRVEPEAGPAAGYVAWYDPSDTTSLTESGGDVSQMNDLSGSGHHFTQGTGAAQPATGARTINSLNALDFDDDDYMDTSTLTARPATARTVAMVFELDAASGVQTLIAGTQNGGFALVSSGANLFLVIDGRDTFATYSSVLDTDPHVVIAYLDDSTNDFWVRLDGSELTPSTTPATPNYDNAPNVRIGGDSGTPSLETLDGAIGEIVVYDLELTGTDLTDTETYLTDKWLGTPVADTRPPAHTFTRFATSRVLRPARSGSMVT